MLPGYFVLETLGAPLDGATGDVRHVRLQAACRLNTPDRPYAVANEYIAARVAAAVGLPVPPGQIVRLSTRELGYVCLLFGPEGSTLPPVIPAELAEQDPQLCMGIVMFDCWIRNGIDRHDGNLGYLPESGGVIFDHDLALLGSRWGKAADDLRTAADQPCLDGHCLVSELSSLEHAHEWAARMAAVPKGLIRDVARTAFRLKLINATERDEVIRFLEFRQGRLLAYLEKSRKLFEKVQVWPLLDGGKREAGDS
ncbi:HipA domain-containing protein [Sphaerimonospora thailandensis]|nr:hypothetical protein [Sphaerimonospora thailandensis]